MPYRAFLYNGKITDRIDFTDGGFTTPEAVARAEVAAALGVSIEDVELIETETQPTVEATIPPAEVGDAAPDVNGFLLEGLEAIGVDRANALMSEWPIFVRTLDAGNLPKAKELFAEAVRRKAVTEDEAATLAALMEKHGL